MTEQATGYSQEMTNAESEAMKLQVQVTDLETRSGEIVISSETELGYASVILSNIVTTKKAIEDRRVFLVKPLNDHVSRINAMFKEIATPLIHQETTLKNKIRDYRAEVERKKREEELEQRRQEAAREKERQEAAAAEIPVTIPEPEAEPSRAVSFQAASQPKTVGSMTARKVWKFEVTDAAQVPREFLIVNETAIREAVRQGNRDISGVRIYQDEVIASR